MKFVSEQTLNVFSLPLWRKSIFQAVQVAIAFGSLHLVAQNFPFSEILRRPARCFRIFNFQDCKIFACADVTGHVLLNGGKNKSDLRNPKLPSTPPLIEAFNPFSVQKKSSNLRNLEGKFYKSKKNQRNQPQAPKIVYITSFFKFENISYNFHNILSVIWYDSFPGRTLVEWDFERGGAHLKLDILKYLIIFWKYRTTFWNLKIVWRRIQKSLQLRALRDTPSKAPENVWGDFPKSNSTKSSQKYQNILWTKEKTQSQTENESKHFLKLKGERKVLPFLPRGKKG